MQLEDKAADDALVLAAGAGQVGVGKVWAGGGRRMLRGGSNGAESIATREGYLDQGRLDRWARRHDYYEVWLVVEEERKKDVGLRTWGNVCALSLIPFLV